MLPETCDGDTARELCRALWRDTLIEEDALLSELKRAAKVRYVDKGRFLQLNRLLDATRRIVEGRVEDPARRAIFLDQIESSRERMKPWMENLAVFGGAHPQVWQMVSDYLTRVLRGEIWRTTRHPSFDTAHTRLLSFAGCVGPARDPWVEAWNRQRGLLEGGLCGDT
jgi:hypothetical protein